MKTKKLLLSMMLFACTSSLWAAFPPATGDGTVSNPYIISTAQDLTDFRLAINSANAAAIATGLYVELGDNIVLTDPTAWTIPAGAAIPFKGNFNGKGFKISGLNLGTESTPFMVLVTTGVYANFGFFGTANGATIKNLTLECAYYLTLDLDGTGTASGAYFSVGGLIGQVQGTGASNIIDNCKVTGTISTKILGGSAYAFVAALRTGGIIGNVNAAIPVIITNTSTNLNITSINESKTSNATQAVTIGGIIGDNLATAAISIVNCSTAGSIMVRNDNKVALAGGILGNRSGNTANCEIINCLASNSIEAIGKTGATAGGILSTSPATTSPIYMNVKNNIALNPYIYSKSYATNNPTANRIGNKGTGVTFADNYTLNALDIKVWKSWDGTTGTSTVPTIVEDATASNGLMLDATNPDGQALVLLNAYTSTNTKYNGTDLFSWKASSNGTSPVLNGVITSLNFNSKMSSIKFSINNGILRLTDIVGQQRLEIYTISGRVLESKIISNGYSTSLQKGVYILALNGSAIQKIVCL